MAEDHGRETGCEVRRAALALAALASLPAQSAPPKPAPRASIEQRLQRAEDELAIRRILIDYHWTMDTRDFNGYAALFAKNGEWTSGNIHHYGPTDIHEMMVGIFGKQSEGTVQRRSIEITTNPQIVIDGDHATARSRHLLIWRMADGHPEAVLAGRYEDDLIREDGKWKILRRVDYPLMPSLAEWGVLARKRSATQ